MVQTILDWLHEHYSEGFLNYLTFLVTTYIVWFVAKIYFEKIKGVNKKVNELPCTKHEENLKEIESKIEKKIDELPCTKHEENLKEIESKIEKKIDELPCTKHEENLKSFEITVAGINRKLEKLDKLEDICNKHEEHLKSLDENMTKIITILSVKDPSTVAAFSLKHSPSQLNDTGKKLFDECGGNKMLQDNEDFLIKLIEKDNPETALDVESKAYEVLLSNSYMSIFNSIKQWVYNCPDWEIDSKKYTITMKDVCYVLSLHLRDLYLTKHPDIPKGDE